MNVSINNQFFVEYKIEQYIRNINDVDNAFDISFSIRRFIFDVFLLNEKLKNYSKQLIKQI